jgi:hypothetical protein
VRHDVGREGLLVEERARTVDLLSAIQAFVSNICGHLQIQYFTSVWTCLDSSEGCELDAKLDISIHNNEYSCQPRSNVSDSPYVIAAPLLALGIALE